MREPGAGDGGRHRLRAVELAREHRPHLVLLGSRLPDITLGGALRILCEDADLGAPLVALVNAAAGEREAQAAGASEALGAPLDVSRPRQVLEAALGR